ncbi:hypothetical protein D9M71_412220 [compost metagenome]
MTGTAEQQTPVRSEPVVVQADFLVAQRQVLRDQFIGQRWRQRLGGDDVTASRQHLAAQARLELFQVSVARQHQAAGPHAAVGTAHLYSGTVVDLQHRAVFEDPYAEGGRHARLAQHQVERVQVARATVDQAAGINRGGDHFAHLLRADQLGFMAVVQGCQAVLLGAESGELGRGIGQFAETPAQVAVDVVFVDALGHHLNRFDPGTLQVFHPVLADVAGKALDLVADAANQLAAVAATGTPADATGFQEDHREAALGQFDCGVDAGEAAADHTHVGTEFSAQHRVFRHRSDRCPVVGAGMLRSRIHRGSLVHLFDFTLLQERVITRMICGVGVLETYSLSSTACGGYTSGFLTRSASMYCWDAGMALA